jgi:hypothetical protein
VLVTEAVFVCVFLKAPTLTSSVVVVVRRCSNFILNKIYSFFNRETGQTMAKKSISDVSIGSNTFSNRQHKGFSTHVIYFTTPNEPKCIC